MARQQGLNPISRTVDGTTMYYLYNGHADVTALIDGSGNIQGTYYYDAFGNQLETTGTVNNPFTYAGYQYDSETGLYYLNTRMYDPKTARFMQEDSYIGDFNDPLSLNLYTYCHNGPIMYWDPTGHLNVGISWVIDGPTTNTSENIYKRIVDEEDPVEKKHFEDLYYEYAVEEIIHDQWARSQGILVGEKEDNQEADYAIFDERQKGSIQAVIDYEKKLANNRQCINDPWHWDEELRNNIKSVTVVISTSFTHEQRIMILEAIMISESQRLQDKYRTIYISSDNVISKYITNRGLHEGLEPLYEQYPDARKKNINPLVKKFFGSLFDGIIIGTWSDVFGNNTLAKVAAKAGESIPKTRAELHEDLLSKGYRCNGTSEGGYVTYMRNDGMRVDIRPNGEIIITKKEWLPDMSRKITIRYQWDGTPVPNGGHNTGEFVEPIDKGTFLPPKPGK